MPLQALCLVHSVSRDSAGKAGTIEVSLDTHGALQMPSMSQLEYAIPEPHVPAIPLGSSCTRGLQILNPKP